MNYKTISSFLGTNIQKGSIIFADSNLHKFETTVKEPSSCAGGYSIHTCKICGAYTKDTYTNKTGDGEHWYVWDEVDLSQEPDQDNRYFVRCKICGNKYLFEKYVVEAFLEVENRLNEVIAEIITDDMSDVEKILQVNIWLCENIVYDRVGGENGSHIDRNLKGADAITKGVAVCEGYALMFQQFMRKLNIDNRYVVGTPGDILHAWNQVKLDDGWYWVDSTWDDMPLGEIPFTTLYFLKTGVRAEDEKGGVVCDGTKWLDGILFFEKYMVNDNLSYMNCYDMQSDNKYIFFLCNGEQNPLIDVKKLYDKKFGSLYYPGGAEYKGDIKLFVLKNTDEIKEVFAELKEKEEEPEEEPIDETYAAYEVQTADGTVTVYGKFHDEEASSFFAAENSYRGKFRRIFLDNDEELTDIAKERALQCTVKYDNSVSWSEDDASTYYGYNYEMLDMGDVLSDNIDAAALLEQLKNSSEQRNKIMQMVDGLTGLSIFETKKDGKKKYILVQVFKEYE